MTHSTRSIQLRVNPFNSTQGKQAQGHTEFNRSMKKPILFVLFIIGTVFILSIVQVVVSNSLSTKGVSLGKLEDEKGAYKKENTLLKEKLLLASSYTNIASSAGTLGFVRSKAQVYLTSPLPLAFRQ